MKKPKMEVVFDDEFEQGESDKINLRIEGGLEQTKAVVKALRAAEFDFIYNKKAYRIPDSEPPRYYRYANNFTLPEDSDDDENVVLDDE